MTKDRPNRISYRLAEDILIAHQRTSIKGCSCGWSKLGASYALHVVDKLATAGVLRDHVIDEEESQLNLIRAIVRETLQQPNDSETLHQTLVKISRYL